MQISPHSLTLECLLLLPPAPRLCLRHHTEGQILSQEGGPWTRYTRADLPKLLPTQLKANAFSNGVTPSERNLFKKKKKTQRDKLFFLSLEIREQDQLLSRPLEDWNH